VSEWRSVVTQGLFLAVIMELVEIGKWVFTDGWGGVFRFHLRLNRQLLAHGISLLYAGAFVGILSVFGWRAFRGTPLAVLVILAVPALVAIPFRPFLKNFFRNNDVSPPAKANELPFPR